MAARASWSAVAAPAETPSSVAVVRIMSGTCGFRPSTTPTTTVSVRVRLLLHLTIGNEYPQVCSAISMMRAARRRRFAARP